MRAWCHMKLAVLVYMPCRPACLTHQRSSHPTDALTRKPTCHVTQTAEAIAEYKLAVALQPGYVTAWNNLGDALEKNKAWRWVPALRVHAAVGVCGCAMSI